MKTFIRENKKLISAAILSLGLISSGAILGKNIYKSQFYRTVRVKGLSEKIVNADLAIWEINVEEIGNNIIDQQSKVENNLKIIRDYLTTNGIKSEDIKNQRIKIEDKESNYYSGKNPIKNRYIISGGIIVKSNDVNIIDKISRKNGELIKKGIKIKTYEGPKYIFTKLNDIKVNMIEEATKNAKKSAEEFAKNTDDKIGGIKTANQGVFSIKGTNDENEWEVQYEIEKKVRVVSTITYWLK